MTVVLTRAATAHSPTGLRALAGYRVSFSAIGKQTVPSRRLNASRGELTLEIQISLAIQDWTRHFRGIWVDNRTKMVQFGLCPGEIRLQGSGPWGLQQAFGY